MEDTKPKTAILYYLKDHADTALAKAVSLYRSGKIRENEMGANDYYAWGDALQGLRQYDQAINEFTKSLNVNPQLCEALNNIGNTYILKYQSAGRPEHLNAAESFYSKAIKCNPTDAAAHCGLGNVFMRKWRASGYKDAHSRQAAIDQSEEALKFDPTSPEAAVNMGYIQFMDGHRDDALTYFRALGEKFPDKAVVFVNFGYLLWKTYIENGKTPALQDAIDQTKRAWEFDQKSYIAANDGVLLVVDSC